ncbi:MAG TPA: AAA family ATPase [Bryobacteraceae bacterium]|nr:AAA family ATPase [Bryobacteraceae bacterium]
MLKSLTIEGYRSCAHTSLDLDTNLSVLIGANGSGKTNILQAILLLRKLVNLQPHRPNEPPGTINPKLTAVYRIGDYQLQMDARVEAYTSESNNDIVTNVQEKWTVDHKENRTVLNVPLVVTIGKDIHEQFFMYASLIKGADKSRKNMVQFMEDNPVQAIPLAIRAHLNNVAAFCKGIKYYGASQFTNPGSCAVSFEIDVDGAGTLYRSSRHEGHTRILYDMYRAYKKTDDPRFQQFLDVVGPQGVRLIDTVTFKEVETSATEHLVRVGGNVEIKKRKRLLVIPQFRIGRLRISPNQLSEGTFKTLVLLFHVVTADSTALLIEEPEVCIHHGLLSSILELIKLYSRNKVVIISTHSDFVLGSVDPENVHSVTYNRDEGTIVRHIRKTMSEQEYDALRKYLRTEGNLGEYWRHGGLSDADTI